MKAVCYSLILSLLLAAISQAKEPGKIDVKVLARDSFSWDGDALPQYPVGTPEISILRITIPAKTTVALHKHPVINAGVLLKGQLTVITEKNEVLRLFAGDPIIEVVNKWHHGVNEGEETAEIIVFYAGKKGAPISVK